MSDRPATEGSIEETRLRLESLGVGGLDGLWRYALADNPDPPAAARNLERWLHATGNPRLYLEQLTAQPPEAHRLVFIMGASQPMADSLIQNPELATVVLDTVESSRPVSAERLIEEGRRLLSSSTSQSHSLDRLRYLKQRHNLPIVLNDLTGAWPQETVWQALSDLADALIQLVLETMWGRFAADRGLAKEPPIAIVAFGKLGAREVNYSSDVDLVYVAENGMDEKTERECVRFCEIFGRALSDKMGRGALYRVDLRLRPYGASGPILCSFRSIEAYYKLYAEAWENQALLKSRVIAGAPLAEQWDRMVQDRVFQAHISDVSLEEILKMRIRIEESAHGDDLKRGAGGIRDVEFLTQTLQLVYGHAHPLVRVPATCDALRALAEDHLLPPSVSSALLGGYTFLRKLEHRAQLVGDLQTHSIPTEPEARNRLARLMGLESWEDLSTALDYQRRTIHSLYRSILRKDAEAAGEREMLGQQLGELAPALFHWFDVFPEASAYYRSLAESRSGFEAVKQIMEKAPRLIEGFKGSLHLTELLLSGEIEDSGDHLQRLKCLPDDAPPRALAEAYSGGLLVGAAKWVLGEQLDLQALYTGLTDALLVYAAERFLGGLDVDVVALGSLGAMEMGPGSDADLLLLTSKDHRAAEQAAQSFLAFLGQTRRYGVELEVDLRLRPHGRKGLLVRTYDGFGAYELSDMESWERFAIGHARLLLGRAEAMDLVRHAAYAVPLTAERLEELIAMKRRIESERVKPQHQIRDVKLGQGGLTDIEWAVHLLEMRYPSQVEAGQISSMDARIRALGRAALLNAFEVEALLDARRHLLDVRTWIYLLQLTPDLVPENPDKLARLAHAMGETGPNDFLRKHEPIVHWVRSLFLETLERLHG